MKTLTLTSTLIDGVAKTPKKLGKLVYSFKQRQEGNTFGVALDTKGDLYIRSLGGSAGAKQLIEIEATNGVETITAAYDKQKTGYELLFANDSFSLESRGFYFDNGVKRASNGMEIELAIHEGGDFSSEQVLVARVRFEDDGSDADFNDAGYECVVVPREGGPDQVRSRLSPDQAWRFIRLED